jgi:hypothetical protein
VAEARSKLMAAKTKAMEMKAKVRVGCGYIEYDHGKK